MPVKVLLVDDSFVIRGLLAKAFSADPAIEVAGAAVDGAMAVSMAREHKPDVIILDIEMPVMDGITALPELLKVSPHSKIIMASTLTQRNAEISMKALSLGATDYLAKPSAKFGQEVDEFYRDLIAKVKALGGTTKCAAPAASPAAAGADIKTAPKPVAKAPTVLQPSTVPLYQAGVQAIAIASSTGGPSALTSLFAQIKGKFTTIPIFITQHMPPTFTTILAEHVAKAGERPCMEARNGVEVLNGHTYLAPGDFHLEPEKTATGSVMLRITKNPQEHFCRPAADPMLRALSRIYGSHMVVVVLTGMGQDGMLGAKEVVSQGGSVIAQDEASCVVYGMPKAVVDQGLCRAVLPLTDIGPYLIEQIERPR